MPDADDEGSQTKFRMKGSREGKADGSNVAGPALFPRLHVSDTKKAGPRGPPRNKMALYEQLTIPSHKYEPSPVPLPSSGRMMMNPSMTTPIYQPQVQASSYDSRYSYMPMSYVSTMIPTVGYVPMMNVGLYGVGAGATATSSMNGSSARSTVVDASTESQRVPWVGETFSHRNNSSGQSKLSAPSKKRKEIGKEDDDFAVPTYSSATQASSQARPSANPFQGRQGFSGGRAVQKGKEVVMGKRSSAFVDQLRRIRKENSMEDDASWTSASVECETVSAIDDDVNTLELRYRKMGVCSRDSGGSQMELNSSDIGQQRVKYQKVVVKRSGDGHNKQSITTTRVAPPPELVHEIDSLRAVPEQDFFSSQSSEDRSGEVSEPSQPRRGSSAETESSTGSINFRDVVYAFGQQEFWKAQSTIIRQQKIFSRQIFELHRVIEVQQLLSKTSSLSFNFDEVDEVPDEEEADNVSMPASPVPEVPEIPERCPEANLNQSSDSNSRPVPEALPQPIYPLSVPCQQNFNSGSAWQASPYAANPWASGIPSPLMYAPYPGPGSPGYGAYPYMGASMPVYGNSGGIQGASFPTWQQPGISQPWGALDSVAAWYGKQVVPPAGPMSSMGIVPPAYNSERLTSVINQPIPGSNASNGNARQSREGCDVELNAAKNSGWAKGWGSTEEKWDSGKRVFGPSGDEPDRREGDTGRGYGGYGVGHQSDSRDEVAEGEERAGDLTALAGESSEPGRKLAELESENNWPAGARQEGLQSRTLKRIRTEVPDPDVSHWFRMMYPAKRVMQQNGVIKVVPRAVTATPESAASILLSIQKERQR